MNGDNEYMTFQLSNYISFSFLPCFNLSVYIFYLFPQPNVALSQPSEFSWIPKLGLQPSVSYDGGSHASAHIPKHSLAT